MAHIFITGSSDGLGRMAAELLISQGHKVVLHARNEQRGHEAMAAVPGAETVLLADLSSIKRDKKAWRRRSTHCGSFDAVIHNAGVGYRSRQRVETEDSLPLEFAVNTLAPYILTALIHRPKRLVYLSSGLHQGGDAESQRPGLERASVARDSRLIPIPSCTMSCLAFAFARRWPDVLSNAVEPGWVATKMGGPSATDDLEEGCRTQAWLAVSEDPAAMVSGEYFYHMRPRKPHAAARDVATQEKLLEACQKLSGVVLPD